MRLEVVYRDRNEHEKVYVLEDAEGFTLEANSLGDVALRADACPADADLRFRS